MLMLYAAVPLSDLKGTSKSLIFRLFHNVG